MPNSANRLLRVAAARADFLESGPDAAAGVADVVVASWQRSHAAGVDVAAAQSTYTDDIDTGSLLARSAEPVLEQLTSDTVDMPLVIALTDNRARVLRRIDASPAVGRLLERVQFAPGFNYGEQMMGTNGVGTVLEAGRAVSVVGPEHFTEQLQAFACTGAPIIDPVTGRVEGVLDISTLTNAWSPVMHALVKSAAKDIAQNLLLDRSQAQQAIFSTYLRESSRSSRRAVFAFGRSVFVANPVAQSWFDSDQQRLLREHATFLMSNRDRISDVLILPDGRHVHVRGTRIMAGTEVAGMVVTTEVVTGDTSSTFRVPDDHHLPRIGITTSATSSIIDTLAQSQFATALNGRSPAWVRACTDLHTALARCLPTVVMGETGSGKFTTVAEMFHALHENARSINVDATQFGVEQDPEHLESLLNGSPAPTLYILRNIDQCSTEGAAQAEEFLDMVTALGDKKWFVATLSDSSLESDLPFRQLLDRFEASVTLPPIRCRSGDLDELIASILHSVAPDRSVRLSPEARRVIDRYSWPRNISQLREALTHAIRRRPVGEIQASDLPGYCQTTSRRSLSPIEAAERDLIVSALQEHSGNRGAAASQLGMSRATIYRKVKAFGIRV